VDDIAHIKIRWSETYGWFSQPRGRSVCVPLLLNGVIDYLLRLTGIFLINGICYVRCKWDILICRWWFGLFFLLLISGVRDICKTLPSSGEFWN
jgi:hypothetical protein